MTRLADPSRELLFGLLALQNGLIEQAQLFAAFSKWKLEPGNSLVETLLEEGSIERDQFRVIDSLAELHIKKSGDLSQSLAATAQRVESPLRLDDPLRSEIAQRAPSTSQATQVQPGLTATMPASDGESGEPLGFTMTAPGASGVASSSLSAEKDASPRYHPLYEIARGGMGEVCIAHDRELNREVALKTMLPRYANDPVNRGRFLVEAEVTGGLEHPGIVPVYSVGTNAEGRPFYATRLSRGETLQAAIDRHHRIERETAARLAPTDSDTFALRQQRLLRRFVDVCNAIDYAHGRGVLHRDLKPSNIVVGKHGETLVLDWGLAKATGRAGPEPASGEKPIEPSSGISSVETIDGYVLGTPAYMSPEQARGELDRVGPWSDVYSLGATLYCILTNKPPFVGRDPLEVLVKARNGEFPRPRQLDQSIPAALEAVVLKAMALESDDRYQTARAFADDVERFMADEPVSARTEPFLERVGRYTRRHRTIMSTTAAGLVASLIGLGAVAAVQTRANAGLTSANVQLGAANTRERERFQLALDAVKTFHTGVSEDLLLKEKHFEKLRKSLLGRAADFYGKLEVMLRDQNDERSRAALADAYGELAILTRTIGSSSKALELSHQALALERSLAAAPGAGLDAKLRLLQSLLVEGRLQQATDDHAAALRTLQEGVNVGEELVNVKPSREARLYLCRCYASLASNHVDMSHAEEALEAQRHAAVILQKIVDDDPRDLEAKNALANSHFTRGYILALYLNKPVKALEDLELARKIEKEIAAADPERLEYRRVLSELDSMLGIQHLSRGETDAAFAVLDEGRQTIEKLVEAEPNVTLFQTLHGEILGNLSFVLAKKGNLAEAIDAQRKSCEIITKLVAANPGDSQLRRGLGGSFNNIGDLELAAGRVASALESYQRAKDLIEPLVKAQPHFENYEFGLAFSLSGLGRAHARLGNLVEAALELRGAITIWDRLSFSSLESRYASAGCHAILAGLAGARGSGISLQAAEDEAKRAVKSLKEPMTGGYRTVSELRADRDFKPLEGRADFENLIMDLSLPRDPFSNAK